MSEGNSGSTAGQQTQSTSTTTQQPAPAPNPGVAAITRTSQQPIQHRSSK